MRFKKIIRLFKRGNVCVTGLRGTGKDVLFGNVIARRYDDYVSNLDYGGFYHPLDFENLNLKNGYREFVSGNLNQFIWQYPDGADVYLSDAGVYFPSQYCNELNRDYRGMVFYQALSRQCSLNNFHTNCQNLSRVYDKIREQSEIYIRCRYCFVFLGFVIQGITIYDKYQSCADRVKPCRVRVPLFNAPARMQAKTYRDNFFNTHGDVKNRFLFYRNKSKHNTLAFRELLGNTPYDMRLKTRIKRKIAFIKRKIRWKIRHSLLFRIFLQIKNKLKK